MGPRVHSTSRGKLRYFARRPRALLLAVPLVLMLLAALMLDASSAQEVPTEVCNDFENGGTCAEGQGAVQEFPDGDNNDDQDYMYNEEDEDEDEDGGNTFVGSFASSSASGSSASSFAGSGSSASSFAYSGSFSGDAVEDDPEENGDTNDINTNEENHDQGVEAGSGIQFTTGKRTYGRRKPTWRRRLEEQSYEEIKAQWKAEKAKERAENGESEEEEELQSFVRTTLGLPLHDLRFTFGLGLFLSACVFVMNLVYQYDVDQTNDPEGKREMATNNHTHSLAAIYILQELQAKWLPQEVLHKIENILIEDLYDWSSTSSNPDDGSVIMDSALLFRFSGAEKPRTPWRADETSVLGAAHRIDKPLRSRAMQTLRILIHGPDSKDDVLLDEKGVRVVADYLTKRLLVCLVDEQREDMRCAVATALRVFRTPRDCVTSVSFAPGVEPIQVISPVAKRLRRLEVNLLHGRIAEIIKEHSDFKVTLTGHGANGSVAVAALAAIYTGPVGTDESWAFQGDRRDLSAIVFGPIPAIAGLPDSSEANDHVETIIHDSDIWPRMSPQALTNAKALYDTISSALPAHQRLKFTTDVDIDTEILEKLNDLVESTPGVTNPLPEDEKNGVCEKIPDVRHVGRIIVLCRPEQEDNDDEDEDVENDKELAAVMAAASGALGTRKAEDVIYGWHEINALAASRLGLLAAVDCISCHDKILYERSIKQSQQVSKN